MKKTLVVGTDTVLIDYRPNRTRKGLVNSIFVNGVPLYNLLPNAFFVFRGVTPALNPSVWQISKLVFDSVRILKNQGDHLLALHTSDYLFNRFGGVWSTLLSNFQIIHSANLMAYLNKEIWNWEKTNKPTTLHKGTPYYFLAYSYGLLGNWESAFLFIFNAVKEDRNSFAGTATPARYKSAPAYLYATLVNNKNNLFYNLVKQLRKWLLNKLRSYRKYSGSRFLYSDFESRFLRNPELEDAVFLLIYELQCIISQSQRSTREIRQNDFSKLKNLNTIFDLCLVVDKVFEYRYRNLPRAQRNSLGRNIFNFFDEYGWLRGERDAGQLKGQFTSSGLNISKTPNYIVPKLLARNVSIRYHNVPLRSEMIPLLLIWNLRNYGGHSIKGQKVLVSRFEKIVQYIMFSLFLAIS